MLDEICSHGDCVPLLFFISLFLQHRFNKLRHRHSFSTEEGDSLTSKTGQLLLNRGTQCEVCISCNTSLSVFLPATATAKEEVVPVVWLAADPATDVQHLTVKSQQFPPSRCLSSAWILGGEAPLSPQRSSDASHSGDTKSWATKSSS